MANGWKVLDRRELLDASPWLKVYAETVQLEDGKTSIPDFHQIVMPPYAIIFALTVEGQVAVIEQYKHGVGQRVFELPAGYIEPSEEPLISAKRELREETGLESDEWQPLGTFTVDGNRGCGQAHAFLALNARRVAHPHSGDLEQQTLHFFDVERLRSLWQSGQLLTIAATAVAGLGLASVSKG